jgi:hypothetical protein
LSECGRKNDLQLHKGNLAATGALFPIGNVTSRRLRVSQMAARRSETAGSLVAGAGVSQRPHLSNSFVLVRITGGGG